MALDELFNLELLNDLEEAENRVIRNWPRQYYNAQNVMESLCNTFLVVSSYLLNYMILIIFLKLSDLQFIKKLRLTKALVQELINILAPYMTEPTRSSSITIKTKVLTALRFFASGSYQLDICDNRALALSQPSVSRCISEVSNALNQLDILIRYISFPDNFQKLNAIRRGFLNKKGVPGVVGTIDCIHVAIFPPPLEGLYPEHIYVNHKGYHSINVQLVIKYKLVTNNTFNDLYVRFIRKRIGRLDYSYALLHKVEGGGRVSDKHITENCDFLENLLPGDIVLADRGFTINESVGFHYAIMVKTPAFTNGQPQLHPCSIEKTRKIASVRIHVERVIGLTR
ncbi:Uncharacterized protein FWK35_00018318 [Aphis craccivora]|uniref:DDE Tnp4 domain-containing protein n=1 Tax=Aphis craccivora TaxID=307492 RepID=A0A6G0Y6Z4_APHCR|nr:Uncharacterized protein FWK35_00018318 [Aphis craccivora]